MAEKARTKYPTNGRSRINAWICILLSFLEMSVRDATPVEAQVPNRTSSRALALDDGG
jgi:hypothetical protein